MTVTPSGHTAPAPHAEEVPAGELTVLVYSDSSVLRDQVRTAVGRRPSPELGRINWLEAVDERHLLGLVDKGGIDVAIFDGEARPTGGMGLAKQLKDELKDCPATLVLIARQDDRWLANWSLADAVLPLPIDAVALAQSVVELARGRHAGLPVRRQGD